MALTLASNAITFTDNTTLSSGIISTSQLSAGAVQQSFANTSGPFGFRNMVINGDMRIDQWYNGTQQAFTNPATQNIVDKFRFGGSAGGSGETAGNWLTQQLSADGPGQFPYYIRLQVTGVGSCTTGDGVSKVLSHTFEGNNITNLGWGTPNAKPCTLSFWVRSSIPGLYDIQLSNGKARATNLRREYQTSYTINNANIWEYKTITIQPPTQGVFADPTDITGFGLRIDWTLGSLLAGNTASAPYQPNTWTLITLAEDDHSITTGAVQFFQNLNATFDITGVQFEQGTVATPFEQRPYGTELNLCQRYFEKIQYFALLKTLATSPNTFGGGQPLNIPLIPKRNDLYTITAYPSANSQGVFNRLNKNGVEITISPGRGANVATSGFFGQGGSPVTQQINALSYNNSITLWNASGGLTTTNQFWAGSLQIDADF